MRDYSSILESIENEAREAILEAIEGLDDWALVSLYNEANPYDQIYEMDDLDEVLSGSEPLEVARLIFYGDFKPCDGFFRFNGYGNLESFDYPEIDAEELADYVTDNEDAQGIGELEQELDDLQDKREKLERLEELETADELDEDEAEELEDIKDDLQDYLED